MHSKQQQLDALYEHLIRDANAPLYTYRTKNSYKPVLGEGNPDANVVFIGEAPGENEALTGKPFSGAAGKVLDELFGHIGLDRKDVYVSNVVKDRPLGNRDPLPEEITYYGTILLKQLAIIQPHIIATLGRYSMKFILQVCNVPEKDESISANHGKIFSAKTSYGTVNIIPLYHPAAALYTPDLKAKMRKDIEQVLHLLKSEKI